MGSPTFGFPTSGNNAPPPMFGSMTNPTGGSGVPQGSFPNFPLFGSGTASGPLANSPVFSGTNMAGLSSGVVMPIGNNPNNPLWSQFANSLGKAYGPGAGNLIYQDLTNGLFNPQVASAFLNAMQPGIQRGQSNILQSFGAEGSRFGSAAALGLGDYNSQVNLNEQQTLASMYMQAQQEQLGLLENILPSLHAEQANKGGWMHDVLGALEIAGGAAMLPFSGGASAGLIAGGLGTIGMGLPGGSGNTGTFGMGAPNLNNLLGNPLIGGSSPYGNWMGSTNGVPNSLANNPLWYQGNQADIMQVGGGTALGGADPWTSGTGLPFIP